MRKRTITIRGIPDSTLRTLRSASAANRRSLNAEVLVLLERAVAEPRAPDIPSRARESAVAPYRGNQPGSGRPPVAAVDRSALTAVCRRHHIQRLALFGSYARGEARPDSDVDVVVDFEPGMTPGFGIVTVAEALRPVFGGRSVDLVTRRGLAPRLRERVLADSVPLYGA